VARESGFGQRFRSLSPIPAADRLPELPEAGAPEIYLVGGADSWLRQRVIAHCARHHLGDGGDASFRLRRLDGVSASGEQVVTATRAVGFGGGPVVIVRDAIRLVQPAARDARLGKFFIELVERPPARAVLILEWQKKPDTRRKGWKALQSALEAGSREGRIRVFDCDPPAEAVIARWIEREAGSLGLSLPEGGPELLVSRFGRDLRRQHNELEKLVIYCDDGKPSLDDMRALLGGGTARDRFRFTSAVESGRPAEALGLLDLLLAEGESPQMLLALLYNLAVRIQIAQATRPGDGPLHEVLRLPPAVASRIARAARRFDAAALRRVLTEIAEMDFRLKSTNAPARVVLGGITLRLTGTG